MQTNKQELKINDKLIRVSLQTWQKLRTAAFCQNSHIKTVLDNLVSENLTTEQKS